ncbi:hypothetical protein Tco_0701736 [Tanacetum coccineum]
MSTYLKNMAGYKHNQLKNKSFDDIQKLFDKAMKRVNTFVDMDTKLVERSEQKVDEDKETAELQRLIEVVPDKEEVAIDAIPLETKPPSIVDYKIHKEGRKTYYQIIRADGSSKMPEESYERVLWGDLKIMFDPHVEDQVWRNQQDYRVLDWKLYDSCGVHSLRKQNVHIHMLGRIVRIKRLLDDLGVTAAKFRETSNETLFSQLINGAKVQWTNVVHNQDLVLEAFDKRQIGKDFIISPMDNVYKLVPRDPVNLDAFGLLLYTLSSEVGVITGVIVVSLRGTTLVEVIPVKGHLYPTIVKVIPVGFDPLALVGHFTPVEYNKGLLES